MAVGYHRIKKIQFVAVTEAKYVNHSDCADQYGEITTHYCHAERQKQ